MLSGVQVRAEPPRPPIRSSRDAVSARGVPPAAGTTLTQVFVYHSSSRPSWETKAIHFPSGDQAGALSVPLRATRAAGTPPAAGMM